METFNRLFNNNGQSASTTHESVSTPEESPYKNDMQNHTPVFGAISPKGTFSSNNSKDQNPYLSQDVEEKAASVTSFSLFK